MTYHADIWPQSSLPLNPSGALRYKLSSTWRTTRWPFQGLGVAL